MIEAGLVEEVRRLMERGVPPETTAMQALGYKEIAAALEKRCTLNEAIEAIKLGTRHYAKRQMTWLRRDGRAIWIQALGKTPDEIAGEMIKEIRNGSD